MVVVSIHAFSSLEKEFQFGASTSSLILVFVAANVRFN